MRPPREIFQRYNSLNSNIVQLKLFLFVSNFYTTNRLNSNIVQLKCKQKWKRLKLNSLNSNIVQLKSDVILEGWVSLESQF